MKNRVTKTFIVITLLIYTGFSALAQSKTWSLGPEVGVSFSNYGTDAGSNDLKAGAIGGLFLTYSIENTFGVTAKLLYAQKGASFPSSNTKQTLNYIEVPIIGRFFVNKVGKFRPNVFVGPSFGFLTGVSNKVGSENRVTLDNYTNTFNTFDMGLTGGVGLNFLIASETYLIVDARYTHGFSDITKAAGVVNNNSLVVTAGISFGF